MSSVDLRYGWWGHLRIYIAAAVSIAATSYGWWLFSPESGEVVRYGQMIAFGLVNFLAISAVPVAARNFASGDAGRGVAVAVFALGVACLSGLGTYRALNYHANVSVDRLRVETSAEGSNAAQIQAAHDAVARADGRAATLKTSLDAAQRSLEAEEANCATPGSSSCRGPLWQERKDERDAAQTSYLEAQDRLVEAENRLAVLQVAAGAVAERSDGAIIAQITTDEERRFLPVIGAVIIEILPIMLAWFGARVERRDERFATLADIEALAAKRAPVMTPDELRAAVAEAYRGDIRPLIGQDVERVERVEVRHEIPSERDLDLERKRREIAAETGRPVEQAAARRELKTDVFERPPRRRRPGNRRHGVVSSDGEAAGVDAMHLRVTKLDRSKNGQH